MTWKRKSENTWRMWEWSGFDICHPIDLWGWFSWSGWLCGCPFPPSSFHVCLSWSYTLSWRGQPSLIEEDWSSVKGSCANYPTRTSKQTLKISRTFSSCKNETLHPVNNSPSPSPSNPFNHHSTFLLSFLIFVFPFKERLWFYWGYIKLTSIQITISGEGHICPWNSNQLHLQKCESSKPDKHKTQLSKQPAKSTSKCCWRKHLFHKLLRRNQP